MKIKFNPNLDFQKEAVESVVDLFKGENQEFIEFLFEEQAYITNNNGNNTILNSGIGNRLTVSSKEILNNLKKIQKFHKLPESTTLGSKPYDFKIDMETGTGKTYVYLKTIFELNKKYNFKKFIIVVPSKAIKEGVNKTIEITRDHFEKGEEVETTGSGEIIETGYNKIGNYFIYDSKDTPNLKDFVKANNIQIMIINIQAFNKDLNLIHQENEDFEWEKPINWIKNTNPVVIIDEPQSVVSKVGRNSVNSLNPLFTLSYSATHKSRENLVYQLSSFDAYKKGLVKGIEVVAIDSLECPNRPYIKLLKVESKNNYPRAQVEMYYFNGHRPLKKKIWLDKDDGTLYYKSGELDIYKNFDLDEINREDEYILVNNIKIKKGVPYGGAYDEDVKRVQIRKTIEEHLKKEKLRLKEGIKVLSLFFIDEVSNYRIYENNGTRPGRYAEIFEEEYEKLIKNPEYAELDEYLDFETPIEKIHDGYFARDNNKHYIDKGGDSVQDETAYNLIMRDKEKLLSIKEPLRFIFSHSTLKEGWDNPNVFQICTLNQTQSNDKKRQEIGRGMRLCVNSDGDRITDKKVNRLTVMANESYDAFVSALQQDMEEELGIKFGVIEKEMFKDIIQVPEHITDEKRIKKLRKDESKRIHESLVKNNYISKQGIPTAKLRDALGTNHLEIDEKFDDILENIIDKIEKRINPINISNRGDRKEVEYNNENFNLFMDLWDKIKGKTKYSIDFDSEELISNCSKELEKIEVSSPAIYIDKHYTDLKESGIEGELLESLQEIELENRVFKLPNILEFLQKETFLTRKTLSRILLESNSLDKFKENPRDYMDMALKIIKDELNVLLLDGIKYSKIDGEYSQEIFNPQELYVYIKDGDFDGAKVVKSEKSIYNYIKCDSGVEVEFAKNLEKDSEIVTYAKLPSKFKINTPIGTYNPDWAILTDKNGLKTMYFVIETKGDVDKRQLRFREIEKIKCGEKHFKSLETGIIFKAVDSYKVFKKLID